MRCFKKLFLIFMENFSMKNSILDQTLLRSITTLEQIEETYV